MDEYMRLLSQFRDFLFKMLKMPDQFPQGRRVLSHVRFLKEEEGLERTGTMAKLRLSVSLDAEVHRIL